VNYSHPTQIQEKKDEQRRQAERLAELKANDEAEVRKLCCLQ
jgi:hypothetical protein